MRVALRLLLSDEQADALGVPRGANGYLKDYDVNALDGVGVARIGLDINDAMVWPGVIEALDAWRTQSTVRPVRDDGKPNRPLTAYTAVVVTVP